MELEAKRYKELTLKLQEQKQLISEQGELINKQGEQIESKAYTLYTLIVL